jgi:hypothetical protein
MKRRWNLWVWLGFLFAVAGLFTYPFFAQYPITRDFPWANLLLFGVAGILLAIGLVQAFGNAKRYRGKISGPILTTLSLVIFGFFAYAIFYVVKQVPASLGAPQVGQKAPDFTLPDQNGKLVSLSELISENNTRAVLLIFYRGHW